MALVFIIAGGASGDFFDETFGHDVIFIISIEPQQGYYPLWIAGALAENLFLFVDLLHCHSSFGSLALGVEWTECLGFFFR